jgi:predicted Zn finger-like uncharacterized protein
MLIVCPSCATSYDVELASLSPDGRQVRCSRCRTIWRAEPNHADKLLLAAADLAPSADDGADVAEETISRSADELASVVLGSFPSAVASPEHPSLAPDFSEHDSAAADISEGEGYSAEVDAPPIVPADLDEGRSGVEIDGDQFAEQTREQAEDIESVAARRQRHRSKGLSLRWPLSLMQTGILALALVDVILVGWRSDVVRAMPQTASFYSLLWLPVNLRDLTFNDVATSMEQHEGVPILVVEGNIFNAARKPEDVPRLKFIVRNAAGQEIYSWTAVPSRAALAPGEAVAFRTRLASPPADARDLVLRFVNRRDLIAGSR